MINSKPIKAAQLRKLINSNSLEFIYEAHNGISGRIAEEAGFSALWASGLTISASLGVRDNNEASWTQVLDVCEYISDATSVPLLLDGDTGFGNFNNVRRLVNKLESRDVAGVCIEDKIFPKKNSFINGNNQPLANIEEFSKKIAAAKSAQKCDDFVVVARTEAFIAGWGLAEALKRAEAYMNSGADAILVHSKINNFSEVQAFCDEWSNRLPIIIVPTKYYSVRTEVIERAGVSAVIWANHSLRSAVTAMQKTAKEVFEQQSLITVEDKIASVGELFRLQGEEELKEAEKRFLPVGQDKTSAIVLAASQGTKLGERTQNTPKAMLPFEGKEIVKHIIDHFRNEEINDISIVRGFAKEKVSFTNITYFDNDSHATTSELTSLLLASSKLKDGAIISYGDIVFQSYVLRELLTNDFDISIVVNAEKNGNSKDINRDFVIAKEAFNKFSIKNYSDLLNLSNTISSEDAHGEFTGLCRVSKKAAKVFCNTLLELSKRDDFFNLGLADLLNALNEIITVKVIYVNGGWWDIDSADDLLQVQINND